jgi:hypothetical protein
LFGSPSNHLNFSLFSCVTPSSSFQTSFNWFIVIEEDGVSAKGSLITVVG